MKCNFLNLAGRSTFIKSTINSRPIYWFNLLRIPIWVAQELDRRRRKFFWNELEKDKEGTMKLYLLNWKTICMPKEKGGLGLGFLEFKNSALLSKWWWRWYEERDKPWWEVIRIKYIMNEEVGLEQCWDKNYNMSIMMDSIVKPIRNYHGNEWL